MRVLARWLLSSFSPIFFGSFVFFVILINITDLFVNIGRYIEREVVFAQLLELQFLFLPQCVIYALPISILFSISYTMGNFYANNELIAVFASGVSLRSFVRPFLVIGVLLCFVLFFVQNRFAIPMLQQKKDLSVELLRGIPRDINQSDISLQAVGGRVIYHADYYDADQQRLNNVITILRTDNRQIELQLYADWAVWKDDRWEFHKVLLIRRSMEGADQQPSFDIERMSLFSHDEFNLEPDNFQNKLGDVDQMNIREAQEHIRFLRSSGFPFRKSLTKYHERYAFALTPLIVTLLSVAVGGSFRKNVLVMSLFVSLGLSIVYYSIQLLSVLLATHGFLNSLVGAWAGTLLTFIAALYVLKTTKT